MFIDGIGISGYRSFWNNIQLIGPFSKINLFIGQNNSGKSNMLLYLSQHYQKTLEAIKNRNIPLSFKDIDRPVGDSSSKIILAFPLFPNSDQYNSLIQRCESKKGSVYLLKRILDAISIIQKSTNPWLIYETQWVKTLTLSISNDLINNLKEEKILTTQEWQELWSSLTSQGRGNIDQHWFPETLDWIYRNVEYNALKIDLIPAIRRIEKENNSIENDYSGIGIIDRLAKLQNPDYNEQELKARFEEINNFLRNVTGNNTAKLEVPYERDKILVHMNEKTLPLSSLGTGIHEVVILASAATVLQNQVICIEEPELHLHPTLQKKLLQYLSDHTSNQYFISTHSAHLLDVSNTSIFHVKLQNNQSIVTPVISDTKKFMICTDLGYKASDLLQANSVIWVEGPSDRVYLNYWIKAFAPDLIEGLHYSIMFYGGRLLSHLTAEDSELEEFISLRRLNRNICIIIDSDRSSSHARINPTKRRVVDEFNTNPGFAWVTKGREIENYIDPKQLEKAVSTVHQNAIGLISKGIYDNCLEQYLTKNGKSNTSCDKVKVAREIVKFPPNFEILDLHIKVKRLVDFIHDSNR